MSFSFKGNPIPNFVKITGVNTSVLPPFSISLTSNEQITGSRFLRKKEEYKVFSVSFVLKAENPEDLKVKIREFSRFLTSEKPEPFILEAEKDKIYYVILSGNTEYEQSYDIAFGAFEFIAPDPYAYGEEKTVTLTSGGTIRIDLSSTAPSYPIITATALQDANEFRVSRGDQIIVEYDPIIRLYDEFKTGDVIEINNEEGKVTVNGQTKMPIVSLESDFFHLSPGSNWVNCSNGFDISMTYIERWK